MKPKYRLSNPQTDLYVGDCRRICQSLPSRSVDLIFADPPFNWQINYGDWKDDTPRSAYLHFTYNWFAACERFLKRHGSSSGTTATVARILNRRSISIEINSAFALSTVKRIQAGAVRVEA